MSPGLSGTVTGTGHGSGRRRWRSDNDIWSASSTSDIDDAAISHPAVSMSIRHDSAATAIIKTESSGRAPLSTTHRKLAAGSAMRCRHSFDDDLIHDHLEHMQASASPPGYASSPDLPIPPQSVLCWSESAEEQSSVRRQDHRLDAT